MKLSKSETLLIQILIIMVVIAVGFFIFLSPMMNLIQTHKLAILSGESQLQEMNMVIEQADSSKPLIEILRKQAAEKAKSVYPLLANVQVDDELMNLAYQTNTTLSMLLIEDFNEEGSENADAAVPGIVKQATITLLGEIDNLYRFIDAVNNYSKSMVIASVAVENSTETKADIVLYFMQADMSAIQ
ncbi:hypothetical protein [Dielma fastidiosa]|uniref:hypothetical protein n=1 Tax=Dielma fastidiosa TaxID=1034346 RepID=UPI0035652A97